MQQAGRAPCFLPYHGPVTRMQHTGRATARRSAAMRCRRKMLRKNGL